MSRQGKLAPHGRNKAGHRRVGRARTEGLGTSLAQSSGEGYSWPGGTMSKTLTNWVISKTLWIFGSRL
jgi:hypothetical protein